jgi:class 3 adenylate cyclase
MEHDAALDMRDMARTIRTPTLIVTGQNDRFDHDPEEAALLLPDVRMVRLPGRQHWYLDPDSLIGPVLEFFGRDGGGTSTQPSGTAVILFVDIADSTALTERLGDARFRDASKTLDERLRGAVREAGGIPVEGRLLGDGLMATFTSGREAIEAALRCQEHSAQSELRLRIGVHAGDVIREEDNIFGGAVNVAARIQELAMPGEVLVSDILRGLARTSAGVTFEDRGERELKGVSEPVRVWAVRSE